MELSNLTSLDALNDATATHDKVLLIVSRNACPGCVALSKALETHAELQSALAGVKVVQIKLEAVPTIAQTFGLRVAPSMILFSNDEEVKRVLGFNGPNELLSAVRAVFAPELAEAA